MNFYIVTDKPVHGYIAKGLPQQQIKIILVCLAMHSKPGIEGKSLEYTLERIAILCGSIVI